MSKKKIINPCNIVVQLDYFGEKPYVLRCGTNRPKGTKLIRTTKRDSYTRDSNWVGFSICLKRK